jgi:hypothetical protein
MALMGEAIVLVAFIFLMGVALGVLVVTVSRRDKDGPDRG